MSKRLKGLKVAAPIVLAVAGFVGGCSQANGEDGGLPGLTCKAELKARINAVKASSDALISVSNEMKLKVATACANIAGMTAPTSAADVTDDDVNTLCTAAEAEIDAQFMAAGTITATIVPAQCTVNASAQFDCEADCQASADCMCEAEPITVRCDPGELSGQCSGTCQAGATCEGSANVAVDCEGTCEGECDGTCSGTCSAMDGMGNCAGSCDGTCSGQCKGSCTITGDAGVTCSGGASCTGGCSVEYTEPKCTGELKPPSCMCDAAAKCEGSCSSQASLEAECTPPSITITASGTLDATFVSTLEANVPALLEVVEQGKLAVSAAADVAADVGDLAGALSGATECLASGGAAIVASVEGAAKASLSVNVSVMASASASGKASGSTG